jgi:hypothetical protein
VETLVQETDGENEFLTASSCEFRQLLKKKHVLPLRVLCRELQEFAEFVDYDQ